MHAACFECSFYFNIRDMKKLIFTPAFSLLLLMAFAQTYTVGVQSVTWTDASRSNRSVPVEFHYPGTNSAIANDSFPFVVFGHGFDMTIDAYYPWADSLASHGYIVALTSNEGGLSPSHANLAQDLIYIYNNMISQSGTNASSPLYHHVRGKGAIGGHSMGGGCTVLSCQYSDMATCYFTFAAATTNPSSITAAPNMLKPYLAFAGSTDCIAPPSTNQIPMYDSSSSVCKTYIEIKNATHCQFAASNVACNFGEGVSGCAATPLSRASQQNQVLSFLIPYLDYYLKGICSAWTLFHSRYTADVADTLMTNCNNTVPSNPLITGVNSFCSGSSTTLTATPAGFSYNWSNGATGSSIQVSAIGNYSFTVSNGVCSLVSPRDSVTMKLPPATPSVITAPDTVCSHAANISISVVNDTAASSYAWILPAGWIIGTGTNTSALQVTSSDTSGVISVAAHNSCGNSSAVQKTIVVVPSTLGVPNAISGPVNACAGQSLQYLIAPVSGASSYMWTVPVGWSATGSINNDTLNVLSGTDTANIQVQARNGCGLSTAASLTINVKPAPVLGSITGQDSICLNNEQPLGYSLHNSTNADSLVWVMPVGWILSAGQNTDSITISVHPSSGVITVTGINNCGVSNPGQLNIVVSDTPQVGITNHGDTLVASGANSYQWYLNGTLLQGATTQTYITTQSGLYTVVGVNSFNCEGTSAAFNYTYLSLSEVHDNEMITLFPNPVNNGSFRLMADEKMIGRTMILYDATGRSVLKTTITGTSNQLNVNTLSSGVYLIEIDGEFGLIRKKLIIENH
jgi:PKD-like domain/Secretion system C-terminal sorting domain